MLVVVYMLDSHTGRAVCLLHRMTLASCLLTGGQLPGIESDPRSRGSSGADIQSRVTYLGLEGLGLSQDRRCQPTVHFRDHVAKASLVEGCLALLHSMPLRSDESRHHGVVVASVDEGRLAVTDRLEDREVVGRKPDTASPSLSCGWRRSCWLWSSMSCS